MSNKELGNFTNGTFLEKGKLEKIERFKKYLPKSVVEKICKEAEGLSIDNNSYILDRMRDEAHIRLDRVVSKVGRLSAKRIWESSSDFDDYYFRLNEHIRKQRKKITDYL